MKRIRFLAENAVYHVIARINRGSKIFRHYASKKLFMRYLKRVKEKYDFTLFNFCIMGNHVHLIIRPDGDDPSLLSDIMQWLLGNFSRAWNKAHNTDGHLWHARFFSRIVYGYTDLLKVFDYVCQNPVKAGVVKRAQDWIFGGLWDFVKGEYGHGLVDYHLPYIKKIYKAYIAGGERFDLRLL